MNEHKRRHVFIRILKAKIMTGCVTIIQVLDVSLKICCAGKLSRPVRVFCCALESLQADC